MFKFLFILFCVLFLLKLILKPLLRFVIQNAVSKMANQGGGQFKTYSKRKSNSNVDINIPSTQKKYGPSPNKDSGDYIEFEEIK